ncbi:acetyl-CoA carboxylase biotin carboxyl carrier protein subunit [Pseudomonas sp. R5(2019)]|uniref:acetyl-CoA carboxylase biotin carboxyl carrier protein n=1 Tax=Pseudomonas sp. R5(2019) TaxID=2697566 RepID=UPI0014123550|nr:acetyl-CoA carboxylase biotin carboxyl carrier protein subunit [Pseudomonas sp. R5(2019)]NBA97560.1 acetyl-CoA carboxylase biotin carboxyl carrier protein subunit [Pseudomonas sp. R5(2019)]
MKPERIKALIDLMADSDLSELHLSEGDAQLRLLRDGGQPLAVPVAVASIKATEAAPTPPSSTEFEASASLYGVLHLTPSPDQPPFVQVGSQVEVGQTLAIIEAMKMFHPLKAQATGVVKAILACSGDEVQAGQALMLIG